jgi:hypothetical protein
MEAGSPSSAGSTRGGGDREEAARVSGGEMRARVCARVRTPQGVGVLLLVGGAIVGAAVVAWRHHSDRKNAKNHQRGYGKKSLFLSLFVSIYDSCCLLGFRDHKTESRLVDLAARRRRFWMMELLRTSR